MPLLIVATPLGTLADLSPHARDVLSRVPVIAAEDTRRTRKLLSACELPAPEILALHAHNEARLAERLAERAAVEEVALVSDAGTPAVSDPGRILVERCLADGVEVRSVPGPSALAAALAASGLPAAPSTFLGFPPRKGLANYAAGLATRPETLVLFEAPSRVARLVRALAEVAPHREAALCREISKRFEEIVRAPLPDLATTLEAREIRGECVLVVGPGEAVVEAPAALESDRTKDVAAALASRWGVKKRDVYQRLLAMERELTGS